MIMELVNISLSFYSYITHLRILIIAYLLVLLISELEIEWIHRQSMLVIVFVFIFHTWGMTWFIFLKIILCNILCLLDLTGFETTPFQNEVSSTCNLMFLLIQMRFVYWLLQFYAVCALKKSSDVAKNLYNFVIVFRCHQPLTFIELSC